MGYNLIDVCLMMVWVQLLYVIGDDDCVCYIVQWFKEFCNVIGDEWLVICKVVMKLEEQFFQCVVLKCEYSW